MTEGIKIYLFSHDFSPRGYNFVERGEELSGGKVFIKVEDVSAQKFKYFETKEAANTFMDEENKPYLETLREYFKWLKENPKPVYEREKYRSFLSWL